MSNTQHKHAARHYQRLHPGTSYTEALRRVRARPVTLRLQLEQHGPVRPKPMFIDGRTAAVGQQDLWCGDPVRVIGFTESSEPGSPVELLADIWLTYDPEACLGLHLVTADTDDRWSTFTAPVEAVKVLDSPAPALPDIDDLVAAVVRPFSLEIREANHDEDEFYLLGTFAFATAAARDAAYAVIDEHEHDCQDPQEKACYLVDLCEDAGLIVDTKEVDVTTAQQLLDVDSLEPLRASAREFNAAVNSAAFWGG